PPAPTTTTSLESSFSCVYKLIEFYCTAGGFMQPDFESIIPLMRLALAEDIGTGDVTSEALIPESMTAEAIMVAREPLVACGMGLAARVFDLLGRGVTCEVTAQDGQMMAAG